MTLELTAALLALVAVAVSRLVRRRPRRDDGPFPDVPDASPTATPVEAPGLTLPYSSLDPFAPPKQLGSGARTDRTIDD
jgi:hypothetical protein